MEFGIVRTVVPECQEADGAPRVEGRNVTGPPQFSVVICTYNRASLLERSVRSVLDQTFRNFEVVVVDDGSTDHTRAVVAGITDPRVRYVGRDNGGLSAARNTGVANSHGRFVTFLDDDDEVFPAWLQRLCSIADTDQYAVITCGATVVDEQERPVLTLLPQPLGPAFEDYRALFRAGTFAVRREAYDLIGGYAEGLQCSHQTELALRLLPLCRSRHWGVGTIEEPLVRIRARAPERRRQATPGKLLSGTRYLLDQHRERLSRAPELLADYCAVTGVAAARLGHYQEARRFLRMAARTQPRHWRHHLRLIVSLVPPLCDLVWKARSYNGTRPAEAGATS
jgi:glycosyltransferase involved in cell wall biosynthesis